MTQERDAILGWGVMLACGAAVAASIGLELLIGFIMGVVVCIGAAVR